MTELTERQREEWTEWEFRSMKRENKFSRALWIVLVVMTVLVLLSAVASVVMYFVSETNKGLETTVNQILMSVLALLCFGIPIFFKRKLKVYIPPLFLIVIYLFIYAHFILGEIFRVYDKSMIFDKILHTTGGVVIAGIGVSVVFALTRMESGKVKLSPFFVVLFSFCFALAIEYLWELFEYSVDRLTDANMQRWKDSIVGYDEAGNAVHSLAYGNGLSDSMGDMFVNVLGALAVCVATYLVMIKKPQWMSGLLIMSEKRMRRIAAARVEELAAADALVPDFDAGRSDTRRKRRKSAKRRKRTDE